MRKIVRSKSDTELFFEKENLDIIHGNLKKMRSNKFIQQKKTTEKQIRNKPSPKKSAKQMLMDCKLTY